MEKLISYFLNKDLNGLEEELSSYLNTEETKKLISFIDYGCYYDYYGDFYTSTSETLLEPIAILLENYFN